jgi:hypothetical protein
MAYKNSDHGPWASLFTEKEKIETCVLPTEREIDQGFRN